MDIYTALNLLVIGMVTVFVVLLLVYTTGNLLIRFVNAYTPESTSISNQNIPKDRIAVINAAVEDFTKGTGRVTRIEKLK